MNDTLPLVLLAGSWFCLIMAVRAHRLRLYDDARQGWFALAEPFLVRAKMALVTGTAQQPLPRQHDLLEHGPRHLRFAAQAVVLWSDALRDLDAALAALPDGSEASTAARALAVSRDLAALRYSQAVDRLGGLIELDVSMSPARSRGGHISNTVLEMQWRRDHETAPHSLFLVSLPFLVGVDSGPPSHQEHTVANSDERNELIAFLMTKVSSS